MTTELEAAKQHATDLEAVNAALTKELTAAEALAAAKENKINELSELLNARDARAAELEKTIDRLAGSVEELQADAVRARSVAGELAVVMRQRDELREQLNARAVGSLSELAANAAANAAPGEARVSDAILAVMAASGCDHETAVARLFDASARARSTPKAG